MIIKGVAIRPTVPQIGGVANELKISAVIGHITIGAVFVRVSAGEQCHLAPATDGVEGKGPCKVDPCRGERIKVRMAVHWCRWIDLCLVNQGSERILNCRITP